jgi:hypothetical protein
VKERFGKIDTLALEGSFEFFVRLNLFLLQHK